LLRRLAFVRGTRLASRAHLVGDAQRDERQTGAVAPDAHDNTLYLDGDSDYGSFESLAKELERRRQKIHAMTGNIYLDLTNEFNEGELRAILSSGQAIVVYGLAFASKRWRLDRARDTGISQYHLARFRATRRALPDGCATDVRWMRGGWSAHFEFNQNGERIRCDFVTRPRDFLPMI
jgi:hypothetical protein